MKLNLFSGFHLFGKAYRTTRHEIGVSLKVLLLVTSCFAILPYARKSWVEVDKQGKVKRVIKTK